MLNLESLENYLAVNYPHYRVGDFVLSSRGYLACIKKPINGVIPTISIAYLKYGRRGERGRFISPFKYWDELKANGFPSITRDALDQEQSEVIEKWEEQKMWVDRIIDIKKSASVVP